ncbi:MAG: family 78 glycoside hydrolase catalytic domain [Bacteroidales bacterium]|nr:family 78 glycoside hydrolase catalytic domain [Bacteroidales bacterium]
MRHIAFVIVFINLLVVGTIQAQPVQILQPTVEFQDGSQPLATSQPRFSWKYDAAPQLQNVRQTSYQIIVASTEENAHHNNGDLWDSKTIFSDRMLLIPYEGKLLHSRDHAYWKVIATLTYDNATEKQLKTQVESAINYFEISLLDADDWYAQWIGFNFQDDSLVQKTRLAARYLRKEFPLRDEIREARLYISGLGQYSAYLNGKEVAPEEILKPALSDYHKRVYFNAYDVTPLLQKGDNAIGVMLAGGRYMTIRYDANETDWGGLSHAIHYGTPRLILQLEVTYQDGTSERIVSNESWSITNLGPIRTANEFDGETYDERMDLGPWTTAGYSDYRWQRASSAYPPEGKMMPQPNPNICVQDTVTPRALFRKGDSWILDMGQNMVGYLEMSAVGLREGDTVTLRFAETLNPDSSLFTDNLRTAEATDRLIGGPSDAHSKMERYKDAVITWHPTFVYHGFRYVEITGLRTEPRLRDFRGLVFYDQMATTGTFETSDEILNAVHRNAYWGIRGNYRSMPTDCPQRDERMGWTGDRTTGNYGESYIFGNQRLYSKWLTDIEDSQWANGSLPDVCPAYWRRYTDNMTWPGAFITVADMLHTRYGDEQPFRVHYPAMKHWMMHMKQHYMVNGIMTRDCYGDWCMPPESPELVHSQDPSRITRAAVISTPFYCYLAGKMAQFADLLGLPDDATFFRSEIQTVTRAYNEQYLDMSTGRYDNNTVTANILPLAFGMVPKTIEDKVFSNIVDKTVNDCSGHVSTGVVGIQQLMRTLTEYGRGDLALKIATNDTYPSWGYMVRNGATTIWELWNGNTAEPSMNSGNHVMLLGDLILWDYEYLGGIRALEPGYRKIMLKPYPVGNLQSARCTYESVSGRIESSWRREGDTFLWDIVIPANTEADVYVPTKEGYEVQTFGSGRYQIIGHN